VDNDAMAAADSGDEDMTKPMMQPTRAANVKKEEGVVLDMWAA
jgi:hypothetical protein